MITQGDIWWGDFGEPIGSVAGYQRPMLVAQGDRFNQSRIRTVLCVPLTGATRLADSPGNILLTPQQRGLDQPSVANVSLLTAVDRSQLHDRIGQVSSRKLQQVFAGIDIVLGR